MPRKPIPTPPTRPRNLTPPPVIGQRQPGRQKPKTKPRVTGDKAVGSKGLQNRSQDRLGRLISRGGAAPAGVRAGKPVTVAQARAIKEALLALNAKNRLDRKNKPPATKPFNPLEPLVGKTFEDEMAAAKRQQFADPDLQLKNAYTGNQQAQELTGSYFDQYKQALSDAAGRIKQANDDQVAASQGRVDQAYTEDSAAAKARSDAASANAGKLGLSGTQGDEGIRAAEAARTQGNARVGVERSDATASNEMMENRGAEAVHAKGEALGRLMAAKSKIDAEGQKIAGEKGDFATNYRAKVRDSEREWAAIQSEFGLKKEELAQKEGDNKADRKIEAGKLATQKLVAKIYADADKTRAAATIRVAKLQLEKGKIDQHQYNEIVNIYKGLPKKGKPTPSKSDAPRDPANGSGPNGTMAPWENDAQDRAISGYTKNKYTSKDYKRAIAKAVQAGIPKRLAEAAWRQYIGNVKTPYDNRVRG